MKKHLTFLGLTLFSLVASAQTTYYSVPGAVNPNALSSWNSSRDGSGSAPASFTSAGDVFVLQGSGNGAGTPVSMTTTAVWAVGSGTGSQLEIESGATLQANHAVTVGAATTFRMDAGALYNHNHAGTATANIFAGIESFEAGSTIRISNWTGTTSIAGTAVTPSVSYNGNNYLFANLEINWAASTGVWSQALAATTYYVAGNLTVNALGAGSTFRLVSAGSPTIHIGGTLAMQSANGSLQLSGTTGAITVIAQHVVHSSGTFDFCSGGTATLRVTGDFSSTGGTLAVSGTAYGVLSFNGTANNTLQNVTITPTSVSVPTGRLGATLSNTGTNGGINLSGTLSVISNSNAAAAVFLISAGSISGTGTISYSGTSTLASGGTVLNYAVTGSRTAGIEFPASNGPAAMTMAIGTGNVLTLPGSRTLSGLLTMTSGNIRIGTGNTLALTNPVLASQLSYAAGFILNGTLSRTYPATGLPTTNSVQARFPFGFATIDRSVYINFSAAAPTGATAGAVAITYNYTDGHVSGLGITDNGITLDRRTNSGYAVNTGTFDPGSATMTVTALFNHAAGFATGTATSNLRLTNGSTGFGTYVATTGTLTSPTVAKSGLTIADLSGATLYLGSTSASQLRALYTTSTVAGTYNWGDPSSWSVTDGSIPSANSDVILPAGSTFNLQGSVAAPYFCNNLTFSGGTGTATFNATAGNNLTCGGTITFSATTSFNHSSGTIAAGAVTGSSAATYTNTGGTLNVTGNYNPSSHTFSFTGGTLSVGGTYTVNGNTSSATFNSGTATVGAITISSTLATALRLLGATVTATGVSGTALSFSAAGTITLSGGSFSGTGNMSGNGTINQSAGSFQLTGNSTHGGTYSQTGGSLNFSGNVSGGNLNYNLTDGTFAVGGTYTVSVGSTCTLTGGTATIGNITVLSTSATALRMQGTAITINGISGVGMSVNGGGTATLSAGTVNMTGNLTGSAGTFLHTGGTFNITGNATLTTSYTLTTGTLNLSGTYTVMGGSSTFTSGSATVGSFVVNTTSTTALRFQGADVTINGIGGTAINFTAAGTLTLSSGTVNATGNMTGTTGIFTHSGGTLNLTGNVSYSTAYTLTNGTLNVSGSYTINGSSSTFTSGTATVGSFAVSTTSTTALRFQGANVTINGIGGTAINFTAAGTLTLSSGTVNATGNMSGTAGTFTHSGGTLNLTGNVSYTTNYTLTNGTLNVSGSYANTGTSGSSFTSGTATLGSVVVSSTNTAAFRVNGAAVEITGSAGSGLTWTAAGTATVVSGSLLLGAAGGSNRAILLTQGALSVSGGTLNLNGFFAQSGGTFTQSGGAITIDGNDGTLAGSVGGSNSLFLVSSGAQAVSAGTLTIADPLFPDAGNTGGAVRFLHTANVNWTGTHTLVLGDGVSTTAGTNGQGFTLDCYSGVVSGRRLVFNNVVINGNNTDRCVYGPTLTDGEVNIAGTLTINSGRFIDNPSTGTFNIGGNLVNNGLMTISRALHLRRTLGSNPLVFTAVLTTQSISGSGTFESAAGAADGMVAALTINNSFANGLDFQMDLGVTNTLTMTTGRVNLINSAFTIPATATVTGTPSATNLFAPTGTGELRRGFTAGASSYTFPVGTFNGTAYNYTPAALSFTANSLARTIGVRVTAATHPDMQSGTGSNNYLMRYWTFSDDQTGNGTYSYSATYTYSNTTPNDLVGSLATLEASYWNGSVWTLVSGASATATTLSVPGRDQSNGPLGGMAWTGRLGGAVLYTWTGNNGTDWNEPGNWDVTMVPNDVNHNVVIPSTPNQPVIATGVGITVASLTVQNGANLTLSGTASLTLMDAVSWSGSATLGSSSTVNFASIIAAQTIPALNYGNLTLSNAGSKTLASTGTIGVAGTYAVSGATPTITGSTIDYNGTGAQSITNASYHNLTISGTRTTNNVNFSAGTINVAGEFQPVATFTSGVYNYGSTAHTFTFNGTGSQTIPAFAFRSLVVSGVRSADANITFAPGTVTVRNNTLTLPTNIFSGTGAYVFTGNTLDLNAGAAQTIPQLNLNNLTISGAGPFTFTDGTTNIAGNYTQTAGTVRVNAGSGSNTVNIGGNFSLSGASPFQLIASATATGATVNVTGSVTLNINAASTTGGIKLETVSSSGTALFNIGQDLTIAATSTGTAQIDFGTGTVTDNEVRIGRHFTKNAGSGMFTTTSTSAARGFVFAGSGTQNFSYAGSNSDRTSYRINSGSSVQLLTSLTLGSSATPASTFTVGGTLEMGNFNISTGASSSAVFTAEAGTLVRSSFATPLNGLMTYTFDPTSTMEYYGTGAQTVASRSYGNLTLMGSRGTNNITINGAVGVAGALTNNASFSTGTVQMAGSTLTFNGTVAQTVPALNYANIVFSNNTGGISLGASITVSNSAIVSGNLSIPEAAVISGSGTFTVSNDAILTIASSGGITATGNTTQGAVRVSGTKTYNGGAHYRYVRDASGAQSTGNGLPATITGSLTVALGNSATAPLSLTQSVNVSSLTLTTGDLDLGAQTLTLSGSLLQASGRLRASTGTVAFAGSSAQIIPAGLFDGAPGSFTINNAAGVSVSEALSLQGSLTLSNGLLDLGGYDLSVSSVSGGSATTYVRTADTGTLTIRNVGNTYVTFPVGRGHYNPVQIRNPVTLDWSVRVEDEVQNVIPTFQSNIQRAVQRQWVITPSQNYPVPGGGASVIFTYDASISQQIGSLFDTNADVQAWRYNGSYWYAASNAVTQQPGPGGSRLVEVTGLTSFSTWAISNMGAPLPVTLLRFSGRRTSSGNELKWATAAEQNNRGFAIERSVDGRNFTSVGFVDSRANGGNSSSTLEYSFVDAPATGSRWHYRLRQEDIDGRFKYSPVVLISGDRSAVLSIQGVYPNPLTGGMLQVRLQGGVRAAVVQLQLTDNQGRVVQAERVSVEARSAITHALNLEALPSGVYYLRAYDGDGNVSESVRVVK